MTAGARAAPPVNHIEDTEVTAVSKPKPQVIEDEENQRVFDRSPPLRGQVLRDGVRPAAPPGRLAGPARSGRCPISAVTELGRQLMKDGSRW